MKSVYIVMGSQGQYSDFCEWPVVAYTNEKRATEHADKAQERSLEIEAEFTEALKFKADKYWKKCKEINQSNEHDESRNPDYAMDEVAYYVWTVELKGG